MGDLVTDSCLGAGVDLQYVLRVPNSVCTRV